MMIRTRISELLGIDFPVIIKGLESFGGGELAASAADAGGFGLISTLAFKTPGELMKEIAAVRALTSNSFGVSVDLGAESAAEFISTAVAARIKAVFTSGAKPQGLAAELKKAGIVWVHVSPSLSCALQAEELGADAVVLSESASGGTNWDETRLMYLVPKAAASLRIPIIVSGWITGGSCLIAALALGAEGIQLDPTALSSITRSVPLTAAIEKMVREAVQVQRRLTQACLHALADSSLVPDGINYVFPE